MLQFTIRELLLITLVASLLIGWGVDHRWQDAKRKAAEETSKTATQNAAQSERRLVQVQSELNEHILERGPLLKIPIQADNHTLELRTPEPPLRDPDL
jgi:hypothetical protein